MKTNIDRVGEWLREVGIGGIELRELRSQCCPFHWGDSYIEVNPKTSRRTLRKHFKRDILLYFQNEMLSELPDIEATTQSLLLERFMGKCPGFVDYKIRRDTLPSLDIVMTYEAVLGTRTFNVRTIVKRKIIEEGKTAKLNTQLEYVYVKFNQFKERMQP